MYDICTGLRKLRVFIHRSGKPSNKNSLSQSSLLRCDFVLRGVCEMLHKTLRASRLWEFNGMHQWLFRAMCTAKLMTLYNLCSVFDGLLPHSMVCCVQCQTYKGMHQSLHVLCYILYYKVFNVHLSINNPTVWCVLYNHIFSTALPNLPSHIIYMQY